MEPLLLIGLNKIIAELRDALGNDCALIIDAPNELEKLKRLKMVIFNVLKDAAPGRDPNQNAFNDWLNELHDLVWDAEDITDMFNTRTCQLRSKNHSKTTCFIDQVQDFFSWSSNPLVLRHQMGMSLRNILERLIAIARERRFHLDERQGHRRTRLQTFSNLSIHAVFGRDLDLKNVTGRLIKSEKDKEVVVLVGMGGIGKTTLAKLVYNDNAIKDFFGDKKIWVSVSEYFDLMKIGKCIMEQIDGVNCQLEYLQGMNCKLDSSLDGNKYLLVLDDVWNVNLSLEIWKEMESLFHNCKILVTTRHKEITSIMSESYLYDVECLPRDDCLSLFGKIAFHGGIIPEEFKNISKRIVGKCDGLPLAVTLLGSLMRNRQDMVDWLQVGENDFWTEDTEILSILKLSYDHLPLESQFCFAYCSIFPKNWVLNKIDLIQQWIDNGFISPTVTKNMEQKGKDILMDLLSRCFFQDVKKDYCGNIISFKMHDLIHDLARSIAMYKCGILQSADENSFLLDKRIRFLSIHIGRQAPVIPIELKNAQKLRTLQVFSHQVIDNNLLVDIFMKLKFLRVLNLSGARYINYIPSSIGNLKLLRYVDFSKSEMQQLPETICNLQNLQTLKINFCYRLKALPLNLRHLSKLRHLEIKYCYRLDKMSFGMDQLMFLQTLTDFIVSNDGTQLNELRHLNALGGNLTICNLDHLITWSHLEEGILSGKRSLVSLHLLWESLKKNSSHYNGWTDIWGSDEEIDFDELSIKKIGSTSPDEEVTSNLNKMDENLLRLLQPHDCLKELEISNFRGRQFPSWMSNPSQLLVKVILRYCRNCCFLPAFGNLRYLRQLVIKSIDSLEIIDQSFYGVGTTVVFPCLEEFFFMICQNCSNGLVWKTKKTSLSFLL